MVLTIEGRPFIVEMHDPSPPKSCQEARLELDRYMAAETWMTTETGFRQLQNWIETQWNTENEKQVPSGTVSTGDDWGRRSETQFDAPTATRKLITAAKLYGREQVAEFARHFAVHGMIETHWFYFLKGPPIEAAKQLDDYCTLLPYSEALPLIEAVSDPGDFSIEWPEPNADNVCALQERSFEHVGRQARDYGRYRSPLLKNGAQQLALLLGMVWGNGYRVLGNLRGVPAAAAATLPYRQAQGPGAAIWPVALAMKGCGPPPQKRPLAVEELKELAVKYSIHSEQVRGRLERAMARLRNSVERFEEEDRVVDLAIALDILFMADVEQNAQDTLVPHRAAWFYADSENERRQTEELLANFYACHSEVVRGRSFQVPGASISEQNADLLGNTENVLRSCLKTLIDKGWPDGWDEASDRSALRLNPPRPESKIPSVKSDSLSWSVEEQTDIDRALEAVWRPIVDKAPPPPSNMAATTVQTPAPSLIERYREKGIPYVVTHPARLYMAHPKWPKTTSEPLDERTMYYCERDVVRHTWQWRQTALSKGLVQFEEPTDGALYHPKDRDDWPQPLLSSHEEEPTVGTTHQRTEAETPAGTLSLMPAVETDVQQGFPTEKPSAKPSTELPKPVAAGLGREWTRLWEEFRHDVNVATNSLLYKLEAIHSKHLAEQQRLTQAMDASTGSIPTLTDAVRIHGDNYPRPTYPRPRAFPTLTGEPLFRRTAPGGAMEQTAFRGWVSDVYDLWETRYRTQLKRDMRDLSGAIRPRQDALGDLRHIRNNLLHRGIAKRGEAASCEVLQWFNEGDRMQVRLANIFDFLNQMGWLSTFPAFALESPGKSSTWDIDQTGEIVDPPPAIVSVRPVVDLGATDPRYRFSAGVAFEDGTFGNVPMGPETEESAKQAKGRSSKWLKMTVNEAGDLYVPGLGTASAAVLYREILKGEKVSGPGMWGPPVQFRE